MTTIRPNRWLARVGCALVRDGAERPVFLLCAGVAASRLDLTIGLDVAAGLDVTAGVAAVVMEGDGVGDLSAGED
ncbi:hypothetical protein [Bifidobacterium aquikefiri]|uniref:hypothetical protein n=1 Tax=Bifidobacterium aquikefiri TaxID=1653207 RepID=UPI0039E7FCB0